jgi:O-antigen/teichoic acid export membrane protein
MLESSSLKKKSAIALMWDVSGLLINRGSGFFISILLARLLSPAEFGLVGMAAVFIAISQVFIDVGFAAALIQRKENSDLVYSSVFYFNIFSGLILTILFYFLAPLIGNFYENLEVTAIVRWLSLSFLFSSFNQVQSAILMKQLNFKALTIRNIIASLIGGTFGVIAAFQGLGVYALVIQTLSSAFISTILLWSISSWKPSFLFSFKELKGLLGYSSYVFFDHLVSAAFHKLDVLIIAKVFSPATLGFYSRAVSLKDQVTIYSSTSIQKIFFPVLSSLKDDLKEYAKVYFKVVSIVSFLSFFLTGLLFLMGKEIFIGLFGVKWEASVPMFEVLVLGVCNYPLSGMMVNAFMSMGLSKENFRIGLIRKFIQIGPLLLAYFYGIFEFTVAAVITSYALTFLNIFYLKKYTQLSIKKHLIKLSDGVIPLLPFVLIYKFFDIQELSVKLILLFMFTFTYYIYNRLRQTEGYVFVYSNLKKMIRKWKET